MNQSYSTLDFEGVGTHISIIGFYDGDADAFFPFYRESEDDDIVWRFLSFLKERFEKTKSTSIFAHRGSAWELKFIYNSILDHENEMVVKRPRGSITIGWNIRPDLKIPFYINFHDAHTLSPWPLRTAIRKSGLTTPPETPPNDKDRLPVYTKRIRDNCINLSKALSSIDDGARLMCPEISPQQSNAIYGIELMCMFHPLGGESVKDNRIYDKFIRAAIYGGRNEVYFRYGEGVNAYDTIMQYLSCCDVPMPVGEMNWVKLPDLDIDHPSAVLVEATVKVPKDLYLGPLPHRIEDHLTFPVGEFQDWWDILEFRNAVSLGMVEDYTIHRQIKCKEEVVILDEWAHATADMRHTDPIRADWWKLVGNSAIGKFSQPPYSSKTRSRKSLVAKYGQIPNGYRAVDDDDRMFEKHIDQRKQDRKYLSKWAKPALGMRIRAVARIRHLNDLLLAKRDGEILYCDTDSIYTTATLPTGNNPEMGALQHKDTFDRAYFIRQKLYALVSKGELYQRSSGFTDTRLGERDFQKLLKGEKVLEQETTVLSPMESIARGEFHATRRRTTLRGSLPENRIYEGLDSRPICLP